MAINTHRPGRTAGSRMSKAVCSRMRLKIPYRQVGPSQYATELPSRVASPGEEGFGGEIEVSGTTSRSRSIINGADGRESDVQRKSVIASPNPFSRSQPSSRIHSADHPAALFAVQRQLNKAFAACVAVRASPIEHSRKWATYEVVGHIFRVYFR
ncbi:hypothetical protein CF327_g7754, partial [Tilletia walkeri]